MFKPASWPVIFAAGALLAAAGSAQAQTVRLGSSFAVVQAAYRQAHVAETTDQGRELRLEEVEFAGLQWRAVSFRFDAGRRLAEVRLTARGASFEAIQASVSRAMASPGEGLELAGAAIDDDSQVRICEGADGEVTVSFERRALQA